MTPFFRRCGGGPGSLRRTFFGCDAIYEKRHFDSTEAKEDRMTERDLGLDTLTGKPGRHFVEELLARINCLPIDRFAVLIAWVMARYGFGYCASINLAHLTAQGGVVKGVVDKQVYVEAWQNRTLGLPDAKAFVREMRKLKLTQGCFFTTATFSEDAASFLHRNDLDPRDRASLVGMLTSAEAGVRLTSQAGVYRVDGELFDRLEKGPWEEATRVFDGLPFHFRIGSFFGSERG
jgi:restriction endonuclease Mrr